MTCIGVVRGRHVELEGDVTLEEGTRVRVVPEDSGQSSEVHPTMSLGEWLVRAREGRMGRPVTSDSTDLLREIREERADR